MEFDLEKALAGLGLTQDQVGSVGQAYIHAHCTADQSALAGAHTGGTVQW